MKQTNLDFPLTEFEKATAEMLVSYKIAKKDGETRKGLADRIADKLDSEPLKAEARAMVHRWNKKRIKLGLKPFK